MLASSRRRLQWVREQRLATKFEARRLNLDLISAMSRDAYLSCRDVGKEVDVKQQFNGASSLFGLNLLVSAPRCEPKVFHATSKGGRGGGPRDGTRGSSSIAGGRRSRRCARPWRERLDAESALDRG